MFSETLLYIILKVTKKYLHLYIQSDMQYGDDPFWQTPDRIQCKCIFFSITFFEKSRLEQQILNLYL